MDQNAYLSSLEQRYELPTGYLARVRQIESSGNDRAVSPTGASGPFQFTKGTAKQYGLADPFDFMTSADAAARLARDNREYLVRTLGRDIGGAELYLAHQQGAGGASSLLSGRGADRFNMDVNGGAGMDGDAFASMWLNKYNNVSGGSPNLTVSSRGAPSMTPFVERQSVIKQLIGGEGMQGKLMGMFNPIEGANPRLEEQRFRSRQALLAQLGQNNAAVMANTDAPISVFQTLAGIGSGVGQQVMGGAADRAGGMRDEQLQELLATGQMTPDVLARITALDPEYGKMLTNDQRDFDQQQQLQRQQEEFARSRDLAQNEFTMSRDQAQREHELALASMKPEDRTALEQNLIAAGYDPNGPIDPATGLNEFQKAMREQLAGDNSSAPGMRVSIIDGVPVVEYGPGVTGTPATSTTPAAGAGADVPTGTGKIDPGMAQGFGPGGEIVQAPVPGSAADLERQKTEDAAIKAENTKLKSANDVLAAISDVEKLADNFFATGFVGKALRDLGVGGTPAMDIEIALRPVIANMGFDRLQQMREGNPNGAALGQVTERENTLLQSTIKALDPNGSPELFKQNLQYVKDQYDVIVNTDPNDPASVARYEAVMGFPLEQRGAPVAAPRTGTDPATESVVTEQAPGSPPVVSTQEQYDALPSGATFIEDGVEYVKP